MVQQSGALAGRAVTPDVWQMPLQCCGPNSPAPLPIARLAALAGMSLSSFHQHFRAVTSLSPLQFQKHLRLIEARRLMLSDGVTASNAAFAVGYESVPQFTREYGRMFGMSPVRDTDAAKGRVQEAA